MSIASSCPDGRDLELLRDGGLSPVEVERFAQHLEQCDGCAQRLEQLHGDGTLPRAIIPASGESPGWDRPTLFEDLMRRLRTLEPAVDTVSTGAPSRYRALKLHAAGGLGEVYLAED